MFSILCQTFTQPTVIHIVTATQCFQFFFPSRQTGLHIFIPLKVDGVRGLVLAKTIGAERLCVTFRWKHLRTGVFSSPAKETLCGGDDIIRWKCLCHLWSRSNYDEQSFLPVAHAGEIVWERNKIFVFEATENWWSSVTQHNLNHLTHRVSSLNSPNSPILCPLLRIIQPSRMDWVPTRKRHWPHKKE